MTSTTMLKPQTIMQYHNRCMNQNWTVPDGVQEACHNQCCSPSEKYYYLDDSWLESIVHQGLAFNELVDEVKLVIKNALEDDAMIPRHLSSMYPLLLVLLVVVLSAFNSCLFAPRVRVLKANHWGEPKLLFKSL